MKRLIISLFIFSTILNSSPVIKLVEELVDKNSFRLHRSLINKIFANENKFMRNGKINIISVVGKLKTNGILRLFLDKPKSIKVSFKGSGNPIFFMKIISDSLQDLGYFKYRVLEAKRDEGFTWTIEFISDYILDPTLLYSSLAKKRCNIVNIKRDAYLQWSYEIDTRFAVLNALNITKGMNKKLKTPVFDYWLKFEDSGVLEFISSANSWHPYITLYDKDLNLIKVFKDDKKRIRLKIKISKGVRYIKVSDIYMLNNLKNGLKIRFR